MANFKEVFRWMVYEISDGKDVQEALDNAASTLSNTDEWDYDDAYNDLKVNYEDFMDRSKGEHPGWAGERPPEWYGESESYEEGRISEADDSSLKLEDWIEYLQQFYWATTDVDKYVVDEEAFAKEMYRAGKTPQQAGEAYIQKYGLGEKKKFDEQPKETKPKPEKKGIFKSLFGRRAEEMGRDKSIQECVDVIAGELKNSKTSREVIQEVLGIGTKYVIGSLPDIQALKGRKAAPEAVSRPMSLEDIEARAERAGWAKKPVPKSVSALGFYYEDPKSGEIFLITEPGKMKGSPQIITPKKYLSGKEATAFKGKVYRMESVERKSNPAQLRQIVEKLGGEVISVDDIIKYEGGEMGEDEMIRFFQQLVDTGMAWKLQGHYGRTAKALIDAGYVVLESVGMACDTPGGKIRSKGKGKGLARGKGKGPMGVPTKKTSKSTVEAVSLSEIIKRIGAGEDPSKFVNDLMEAASRSKLLLEDTLFTLKSVPNINSLFSPRAAEIGRIVDKRQLTFDEVEKIAKRNNWKFHPDKRLTYGGYFIDPMTDQIIAAMTTGTKGLPPTPTKLVSPGKLGGSTFKMEQKEGVVGTYWSKKRKQRMGISEKWGTDTTVSKKESGKYEGWTLEELRSELSKLKKSGPHKKGSAEYGKMKELQFAIRAKTGWGKVS